MSVFSADERARIEATISQVEARSAAEIVVVTTPASEDYVDVRLASAVAFALTAAASVHFVWPDLEVAPVLALELAAGVLGWGLSRLPAVLRLLVTSERRGRAVEQACAREFLAHAMFETRERTGVLLLFSELEQRVAILGDKGIHTLLATEGLHGLVNQVIAAIRAGRACDGVCEVVTQLGETLAHSAPTSADDTNELSNKVRER